jgi:hypothetical protein
MDSDEYPLRLAVRDTRLAAPILTRMLATLAARAGLSVDRIGDVVMAGDLVAAAAVYTRDGACDVEMRVQTGCLGLRMTGFEDGVAAQVCDGVRVDGVAALRRLTDTIAVDASQGSERVTIGFCAADAPPAASDAPASPRPVA